MSPGGGRRILLVEDDAETREAVGRVLADDGHAGQCVAIDDV